MVSAVSRELNDYVDYLTFGDEGKAHPFRQMTVTVNLQGLKGNAAMYDSAILALNAWEVTTGLRFQLSTSGKANIVVDNEELGDAYASSTYNSAGYTASVFINIGKDWMEGFPVSQQWGYGSYGLQTFIHEFGHALGIDRIQINNPSVSFAGISISNGADGALVAFDGVQILVAGIDASQLTKADFLL